MLARTASLVLLLAAACGQDDDDPTPPAPPEFEPPGCAWEYTSERPDDWLDTAVDVAITSDGGLVAGGFIFDAGDRAMWLSRFSATGEAVWTRQDTGASVSGTIGAVAVDADDRVAVTGSVEEAAGREDFWVATYSAAGEPIWSVDLDTGGDGADACFGPGGELYVTGRILDPEFRSGSLIWVGKFSAGGALAWSHTSFGTYQGWQNGGHAIVCDPAGGATVLANIVVPGGPESLGPDTHTWITRYDRDGTEVWTRIFGEEFETYSPGAMLPDPRSDGLLMTAGGQLHRLALADGSVVAQTPSAGRAMLAADDGGIYVDGGFSVLADPDCSEPDELCDYIPYWGYAYLDWDRQPIWWKADTANDAEIGGQVHAIAVADGVLAIAGSARDDIWVCYQ